MKRILALLLCAGLLAGCSLPHLPGRAAQTSASQAEQSVVQPTAMPAQLTVYFSQPDETVQRQLEDYCQQRGVTLQTVQQAEQAGLWVLADQPHEGCADLTANARLAALCAEAGYDGSCFALPSAVSMYGWLVDTDMLTSLLGDESALDALTGCSWREFSAFAQAVNAWIASPGARSVTLSGQSYTLAESADENTTLLRGVFAHEDGDYGAAPLTPALAAAGSARDRVSLTGPLNSVYSLFDLEQDYLAGGEGVATGAQALEDGAALLYRGYTTAAAGVDSLACVPLKYSFDESDRGDDCAYTLEQLVSCTLVQSSGWLAVPESADEESAAQAMGFILWSFSGTGVQSVSGLTEVLSGGGMTLSGLSSEQEAALTEAWNNNTARQAGYVTAAIAALAG